MNKVGLLFLISLSLLLYGTFLNRVPVHLNQDELGFSLNAYSIAKSGFDENGRFFPVYFWHLGVMWATPIMTYLTATVLKILPLSEATIRIPSVLVGTTNVILMWFLAKRVFKSEMWAYVSAILLALTPVQFIQSRILLDNLYPVPFVLGWLICLHKYLEEKNVKTLILGVFLLGVGMHTYHASRIMMPLYFLVTIALTWRDITKKLWVILSTFIYFLLPLIPLILWLIKFPDTLFTDQVKYVGINNFNILHRLDVFINFFNPVFLFLKGDASLIHSTQRSGVFLLPLLILLPIGIVKAWGSKDKFLKLLLIGFFTSPIAATIAGDHFRISRALFMIPFAILLATYGVRWLFAKQKALTMLLLLLIPLQFGLFWYNYMKGYRFRSYQWFNYNIGGALESAVKKSEGKESIYLDKRVDFIERYFRFYTIKLDRADLQVKAKLFDPYHLKEQNLPEKSLVVVQFNNVDGQKEQIGEFKKIDTIYEPDATSRFFLFEN
ncbi:MAG: glycosyltransferase family 39 protein [Patescibacteria group bacterium]